MIVDIPRESRKKVGEPGTDQICPGGFDGTEQIRRISCPIIRSLEDCNVF